MSERVVDVLLVEDDPGDALMVRESFAQANRNNRFHVVTDGTQALRFLRQVGEHANAYIAKPADFDGFEEMIRRIDACFIGLIEPPPPA